MDCPIHFRPLRRHAFASALLYLSTADDGHLSIPNFSRDEILYILLIGPVQDIALFPLTSSALYRSHVIVLFRLLLGFLSLSRMEIG
jgi:hypothetical protein